MSFIEQYDEAAAAEVPKTLVLLTAALERLIERNERSAGKSWSGKRLTVFHGLKPPSISLSKYLERIFRYTGCSPSCFLAGYIYIDRLIHQQPDAPITSFNVHRLLVTAVMVASKFLEDVHFSNSFFARVGGVGTQELNRLELELLFSLDFKLVVSRQDYDSYCSYLDKEGQCWRLPDELPPASADGSGEE